MLVVHQDETVEKLLFRVAESLTDSIVLQQQLVSEMCHCMGRLREMFPSQSTAWYLQNCEEHARQHLRRAAGGNNGSANSTEPQPWLPRRHDAAYLRQLTNRLTPKQQQVLSLLLEDIGIREAGRRLGVSHVAILKHRRKIERAAQSLAPLPQELG